MLGNVLNNEHSSDQKKECILENNKTINIIMGSAYLTEGEIKILCSRKISSLNKGLSTNEILAYLFFKLHALDGKVKLFRYDELTQYVGISKRDVYYVLEKLRRVGLIGIEDKPFSHVRTVYIRHYSRKGPSGRFLSLNRTFFQNGYEDYKDFKKLSAGAKSTFIYLLFREKFRINNEGAVVPKDYGNSIEVTMNDILRITKVKKETVIQYIKDIK